MSEENPVENPVQAAPAANPVENSAPAPAPAPNPVVENPAPAAPAPNPAPNPVVMQPVSVGVGDEGELVLQSSDHSALARVLNAMSDVRVVMPPSAVPLVPAGVAPPVVWPPEEEAPPPIPPVVVETVVVEESKKARKPRTPPPNPSTEGKPFYAVFRDDKKKVVHVTPARRLWSEAKQDVTKWIAKHKMGTRVGSVSTWDARFVVIYEGRRVAPNKGSKLARARSAWHIERD